MAYSKIQKIYYIPVNVDLIEKIKDWGMDYLHKNLNTTFIEKDAVMGIAYYFSYSGDKIYFVTADRNLAIQYRLIFNDGCTINHETS